LRGILPNIAAGMIQSGDRVKVFGNASIDGGEVTFWVISGHRVMSAPRPLYLRKLPRIR
jgi:hypothetical protein